MKRYATVMLFAVLGLTACAGILGIREPGRRPFEHRAHVLKGINCVRCHSGVATAGEDGPLHLPSTADCMGCHQKPHTTSACGACHGMAIARDGAIKAREDLRFTHKNHVPRVQGDCVRCHLDIERGADILRPRMATCGSCHAHSAQLTTSNCDTCHINLRDEGVKPDDHLIHSGNFLHEHGLRAAADRSMCASCHAERFCTSCHGATVPALPEKLNFEDPMRAGVHRAGFLARHPLEARNDPGMCTTCHSPTSCNNCHTRERVGATSGGHSHHPTGWLGLPGQPNDHGRAAWREPELCASCHGGAGEALCVGCHKVGGIGGTPHPAGWTGGKRSRTERPCRLCHGAGL